MRIITLLFFASFSQAVVGQKTIENIVCETHEGLQAVLSLYENLSDFGTYELSGVAIRRTGKCYYAELPVGTPVRRLDYQQTTSGLIFSIFELGHEGGRTFYTANAAYRATQYSLVTNQACVNAGLSPCNYLMASINREQCRGVRSRFLPESARRKTAVVILPQIREYIWLPAWCAVDQSL